MKIFFNVDGFFFTIITIFLRVTLAGNLAKVKIREGTIEEIESAMSHFYAENHHLHHALLAEYHAHLAPIYMLDHNATKFRVPSFKIYVNLINAKLMDINEANELLSMIIDLEVRWRDIRLRWKPGNFSGIEHIVLPEAIIWTPDFVYYDQAAQAINLIPEEARYVRIYSTGEVVQPVMHLVRTSCNLNMTEFPFDIQQCSVALGTLIYAAKEISYQINVPEFNEYKKSDTFGWHGNSEWEVEKPKAERIKANNTLVKYEYINIEFTFARHPSFFMAVIIWPVFLLNSLCILGMFVDKTGDCLNKMILGLTTLMAMAVELEIIAEEMPKTEKMPLLASFVFRAINLIALASVVILFVPKIKKARKKLPDRHARKLFQPNFIFLVIFETLNGLNFWWLLSHKKPHS
ncbi:unnamed protein product, partial [Mesorhabditis belari]|uniref:Neurotransmitter-gated ion-channel ligand-binding domain-containing protein n=1 Tax=Mesorhabditis belari TaxID=2138241 RepID=A0AAF3JA95_9BILA